MNDIEMLRRIKQQKGYTLDEMARAMGVTLRTIFRWLHKENAPSPMAQEKIKTFIEADLSGYGAKVREIERIIRGR